MAGRSRLKLGIFDALLRTGSSLGEAAHFRINVAHSFLELGRWSRNVGGLPTDWPYREDLFRISAAHVDNSTRPLYLEFGVFEGHTLRWWAQHLSQPGATFVGFDSFEGLPQTWSRYFVKGAFATAGVPNIDDTRVSFEVGWFDKTVPSFEVPDHDALVVNIDSDLYSSAVIALDRMEPYLEPGALIYFDEFNDRDHELRALQEFLSRTGKRVRALGSADHRTQWLFEVTA